MITSDPLSEPSRNGGHGRWTYVVPALGYLIGAFACLPVKNAPLGLAFASGAFWPFLSLLAQTEGPDISLLASPTLPFRRITPSPRGHPGNPWLTEGKVSIKKEGIYATNPEKAVGAFQVGVLAHEIVHAGKNNILKTASTPAGGVVVTLNRVCFAISRKFESGTNLLETKIAGKGRIVSILSKLASVYRPEGDKLHR